MYQTGEIRSAARRTSQGGADLKSKEGQFASTLNEMLSWWKGKASEAFKDDYLERSRREVERLHAEIRDLEAGLDQLAREVQIAEDQRRAEAHKKALLQKQQKSKS